MNATPFPLSIDPAPFALDARTEQLPYRFVSPARNFDAASSFQNALGHAIDQEHAKDDVETRTQRAREAAEQLVSTAFVQPILASLREMNNAAAPFAPTQAEKQLAPLVDAQLADRYVAGQNFPMVDRIAEQLYKPPADSIETPAEDDATKNARDREAR